MANPEVLNTAVGDSAAALAPASPTLSVVDGDAAPAKRFGGRPPGSQNKRVADLQTLLLRHGCDPFENMAKIAMATAPGYENVPMELRLHANKELAKYLRPQLKAVEHAAGEGGVIGILVGGNPPMAENTNVKRESDGDTIAPSDD